MNENIKEKLALLPDKPGSYQMLNSDGVIIYVGKAKNLKNRVRSYFIGAHDLKTTKLVSNIVDFTYIITTTEVEALLLEISLIKKYRPRYNIDLMDDKTYPYIEITNEDNPKLIITRNVKKDSKNLFGPYPNVKDARETIDLLNRLYPLRKCAKIPKKECIYWHIGNCLAPCINKVEKSEYELYLKKIKGFLNGHDKEIINDLESKMQEASEKLDFENALIYRNQLNSLFEIQNNKQIIINDLKEADIFNYYTINSLIAIEIFLYRRGKIIKRNTIISEIYNDPYEEFESYIVSYYQDVIPAKMIILPDGEYNLLKDLGLSAEIIVPKKGDKKKLVEMAYENAKESLETRLVIDQNFQTPLEELEKIIGVYPKRIEAFDNSNTFGVNPVSSMVVYTNGKKDKNEYRKYNIKTVQGIDDYNSMKEVIYRRYYKALTENTILPDLLVVDGGVTQVKAAKEILDSLNLNIRIVGLIKNDKHQTEKLLFNNQEYDLNKHSKLYFFLVELQEEVHRFAITFHKSLRGKKAFNSILDNILLIGEKTKEKLIKEYKTVDNIMNASDDDLKKLGLSTNAIKNLKEKLCGSLE